MDTKVVGALLSFKFILWSRFLAVSTRRFENKLLVEKCDLSAIVSFQKCHLLYFVGSIPLPYSPLITDIWLYQSLHRSLKKLMKREKSEEEKGWRNGVKKKKG